MKTKTNVSLIAALITVTIFFVIGSASSQTAVNSISCVEFTGRIVNNEILLECVETPGPTDTPIPPTDTPEPTETPIPPTATPTPPPTGITCAVGTTWAETHSWWKETTDTVPRHSHTGACMPVPGSPVDGLFDVDVRYITFASPDSIIDRVRWRWDTGHTQNTSVDWVCPGSGWDESILVGNQWQCTRWVTFTVDPDKMAGDMDDLRFEQLLTHPDLDTASRVGITAELGQGGEILRARGWYTALDYVTVNWPDIGDFIPAGETKPHLSGLVFLPIEFRNCDGTDQHTALFIDPIFHAAHGSGSTSHPPPVWEEYTCTKDGIWLDVLQLDPGEHLLYFQATEIDGRGEHSVALAVPVVVE